MDSKVYNAKGHENTELGCWADAIISASEKHGKDSLLLPKSSACCWYSEVRRGRYVPKCQKYRLSEKHRQARTIDPVARDGAGHVPFNEEDIKRMRNKKWEKEVCIIIISEGEDEGGRW